MKLQKGIAALLILLIPITVFVMWKSQDLNYPTNDEAAYFDLTQKLYLNFQNGPTSEAIKNLYAERYWKPILHPALGVVFLGLAGGDSRLAISFYGGAMYLLLLLGLFFFFKKHTAVLSAAVGASTVALLPWVFGMSTTFNSEIGFSAVAIWLYYYAEDFLDFSNLKKSFGLSLLLFILFILRPVEAALLSAIWLIYLVGRHLRNKQIGVVDLLIIVLWVSLFAVITIFPFFIMKKHWSSLQMFVFATLAILVFAVSALAVFFGKANKGFQIFVSTFFFLSIIWYIPGSYQLFDWIYITNFDYLAKATGNRMGRPAIEFVLFYLKKWGWLPVTLLVIYLIENRANIISKTSKAVWFLLAAVVLFPSLGGVFSYNGDVRYYYAGWLVYTAVMVAEFLRRSGILLVVKSVALFGLTVMFSFGLIKYESIRETAFQKYFHLAGGESFFLMVPNKEDLPLALEAKIATGLQEKLTEGKTKLVLYFQTAVHPFFDSNSANIIAREKKDNMYLMARSVHEPIKEKDIMDALAYSDFVLVGSAFPEQEINTNSEARNKLAEFCKKQETSDLVLSEKLKFYKEIVHESDYWGASRFCLFEAVK